MVLEYQTLVFSYTASFSYSLAIFSMALLVSSPTAPSTNERMAAIRRKYWMFRPIIDLGRLLAVLGLIRDNTGSFEVNFAA